jgi:predicted nuclease of predicted toxin-antitoxin system
MCVAFSRGGILKRTTVDEEMLSGAEDSVLLESCKSESRILATLDLDFANARVHPPKSHWGILLLRPNSQEKPIILGF